MVAGMEPREEERLISERGLGKLPGGGVRQNSQCKGPEV